MLCCLLLFKKCFVLFIRIFSTFSILSVVYLNKTWFDHYFGLYTDESEEVLTNVLLTINHSSCTFQSVQWRDRVLVSSLEEATLTAKSFFFSKLRRIKETKRIICWWVQHQKRARLACIVCWLQNMWFPLQCVNTSPPLLDTVFFFLPSLWKKVITTYSH